MDFEKESRWPLITGGVAVLVAALAIALVLDDSWLRHIFGGGGSGEVLARVVNAEDDVRRKAEDQMAWFTLEDEDEIYENDMVFSGKNSKVAVQFNDGSDFAVGENSLVVFRKDRVAVNFNLRYGEFRGSLKAGQKLKVTINGKTQLLEGDGNTEFVVNKGTENAEIKVLSGQLKIPGQVLGANQKVDISDKGDVKAKENLEIKLLQPANQNRVWVNKESPVQFLWQASGVQDNFIVEVSQTPDFSQILAYENLQAKNWAQLLAEGNYFWRVRTSQQGLKSRIQSFQVRQERPLVLEYPPRETVFRVDPQVVKEEDLYHPTTFVFKDSTQASRYLLEIATDPEFEVPVLAQELETTRADDLPLSPGEYFWRVQVIDSERPNALWSEVWSFSVRPKEPLNVPVLRTAKNMVYEIPPTSIDSQYYGADEKVTAKALAKVLKNIPVARFNKTAKAQGYEIQYSPSYIFPPSKTSSFKLKKPAFQIFPTRPGLHHYRLRALSTTEKNSDFSETMTAKVLVTPPTPLNDKVTRWSKLDEAPKAELLWQERLFAAKYEVRFAQNSQLRGAKSFIVDYNSMSFAVNPGETYFWQVRAINRQNKAISRFSKVTPVRVMPPKKKRIAKKPAPSPFSTMRSPASIAPVSATFATWPQWGVEAGSFAGLASYTQTFSGTSLTNDDLNQNRSFYLSGYWAIKPRWLVRGYYEKISGTVTGSTTVVDEDFSTSWLGVEGQYRFFGDIKRGLGYFAGVGLEMANQFRYSFQSSTDASIVDRPISQGLAAISVGAEYRSYFQLKGLLKLTYYQSLFANSESTDVTAFELTSNSQFAVDASLSHSLSKNTYLGVGMRYRLMNYQFNSDEFGSTDAGQSQTNQLLFRVFVGAEQ